jgi:hypothetical protein
VATPITFALVICSGPIEGHHYGNPVNTVADLIAWHIDKWNDTSVEEGVFGTADPMVIASHLEFLAETAIGAPVREGLFYGASAGCVVGVALEDGRRVVIKAYQRRWGRTFLDAVGRIQEHLAASRFPCPRPILGAAPAGPALATVEQFVPDPGLRTFSTDAEMALSARGLAEQVRLCHELSESALGDLHPLHAPQGELYPQPHNPLFDFSRRADEARWIDELAEAGKAGRERDPTGLVVAHTDWSARNVRLDENGVVVAYDWDSLALVSEAVAAGQAAGIWRATGEANDEIAPSRDEVHAYLSLYENFRGLSFSADQRSTALAAALWVLAYTARCEHALEAVTGKRMERARARLVAEGRTYLS